VGRQSQDHLQGAGSARAHQLASCTGQRAAPADADYARLKQMLARLQGEDSASYRPFRGPDELHDLLLDDLAVLLTERIGQRMPVECRSD
jgi:hypothetical protein